MNFLYAYGAFEGIIEGAAGVVQLQESTTLHGLFISSLQTHKVRSRFMRKKKKRNKYSVSNSYK